MTGTSHPATGQPREGRGPTSGERRLSVLQAGERLGALAHEREEQVQPGDLERPPDARVDVDDDELAVALAQALVGDDQGGEPRRVHVARLREVDDDAAAALVDRATEHLAKLGRRV